MLIKWTDLKKKGWLKKGIYNVGSQTFQTQVASWSTLLSTMILCIPKLAQKNPRPNISNLYTTYKIHVAVLSSGFPSSWEVPECSSGAPLEQTCCCLMPVQWSNDVVLYYQTVFQCAIETCLGRKAVLILTHFRSPCWFLVVTAGKVQSAEVTDLCWIYCAMDI